MIDNRIMITGSQNLFQQDIDNNYELYIKMELNTSSNISRLVARQYDRVCSDARTYQYGTDNTGSIYATDDTLVRPTHFHGDAIVRYLAFSPEENSLTMVKDLIDAARNNIIVLEAFFYHEEIRQALNKSRRRGVEVIIMSDRSYEWFLRFLVLDGFKVKRYTKPDSLMHYKTILVDGHLTFTGSLNLFDKSMTKDREFMMLIDSKELYDRVLATFHDIWADEYSIEPGPVSVKEYTKYKLGVVLGYMPEFLRVWIISLYRAMRKILYRN